MTFWKALQEQDIYEFVRNMCFFLSILMFTWHLILLKRKSLRKNPNVLYHFTSTSLLESIFKEGVLKAINYNFVFFTSNKDKSGCSSTAIKGEKGIVIFSGLALKKFKYKIRNNPLLSILLGFDLIALEREEYCTTKRGDLVLTKMRKYNNMLIVSEVEIRKVKFSLALKREIKTVLLFITRTPLLIINLSSLAFIINSFCHIAWFRLNFFSVLLIYLIIFTLISFFTLHNRVLEAEIEQKTPCFHHHIGRKRVSG